MKHQEVLTAYIASFVDELTACGVRDVVISPGSRSTPVAYCMAEHEEMRVHVNIDVRQEQPQPIIIQLLSKPIMQGCH